ncbi:hypothetical protein H4R34_002130 [Dimargaris verticillata]|uniref:Fanconi-associated nuclease n=1 Tax=Dimargaris verticillata TaxID=2761393 RepID=A0A9W8B3C0_9FUNG|nr:hypothetical protein H4R34_002130 [Dimargaris verticillata]
MPLPRPEDLTQLEEIEKQWAVKATAHAEVYQSLIEKYDTTKLRLTSMDDELYEDFQATFPELNIEVLDEEAFKSEEAKSRWRPFVLKYEKLINDYNFGTLVRKDYRQGLTEDNTMLVLRTQFYCIEIARNRRGLNLMHNQQTSMPGAESTLHPQTSRNQHRGMAFIDLTGDNGNATVPMPEAACETECSPIQAADPESGDPLVLKRYYLEAFQMALNTVLAGEQHLLSEVELTYCGIFASVSEPAQYLLVRLYLRKHDWLRPHHIDYPELPDQGLCLTELAATDPPLLLDAAHQTLELEALLALLTLDELHDLCKQCKVNSKRASGKNDLITSYLRASKSQRTLTFGTRPTASPKAPRVAGTSKPPLPVSSIWRARVLTRLGRLVRMAPPVAEAFRRIHFIYHRRLDPDETANPVTVSVMASIGRWNFPSYPVTRSCDIFADRGALLEYEDCTKLYDTMCQLIDSARADPGALPRAWTLCEACLDSWNLALALTQSASDQTDTLVSTRCSAQYYRRRFTAGWMYTKTLSRGTQVLASLKRYQEEHAVLTKLLQQSVYCLGSRGRWYERLALIQNNYLVAKDAPHSAHVAAWQQCRTTCLQAIADEWVHHAQKCLIAKRLARIEKRLIAKQQSLPLTDLSHLVRHEPVTITIPGTRAGSIGNRPSYQLCDGRPPCVVEDLALNHYQTQSYRGYHAENSLYLTLFGLLMWDVLFAPCPGVFETPYQSAPLDLHTDAFYVDRRDAIEQHLAHIQTHFATVLTETDQRERPRATRCVGVNWSFSAADLLAIAKCLGGSALVGILRKLAQDFRHAASGFPDLCLWHPDTQQFKAVEVKGPGDTLSETQRTWIDIFTNLGIAVEVCHVKVDEP